MACTTRKHLHWADKQKKKKKKKFIGCFSTLTTRKSYHDRPQKYIVVETRRTTYTVYMKNEFVAGMDQYVWCSQQLIDDGHPYLIA